MKRTAFIFSILLFSASSAFAAIVAEPVEYKDGGVTLQGFVAYDDAAETKRPGILVVHEWKGPGSYTERRVKQLAEMGYVAFAVDMYGKEVRPSTHEEAAKVSGMYKSDRDLMRSRAHAGLEVLKSHPLVDSSKLAAIGYCFGGTTVLEIARSGEDVKGVASFHGSLSTPKPAEKGAVKAKVLVLHGGDDKFVTPEEVAGFRKEMDDAGADYRVEVYPGAVHSFTVEEAGSDPSKGMAYNPEADQASWAAMKAFFESIFA